jgi:hypothetical protein
MKDTELQISTVKITDEYNNKKIVIFFDIFEEYLIFRGYCKTKANGITGWVFLAEKTYDVKENSNNVNFEMISKELHKEMIRKLESFEIIKAFMSEVDEIEIKKG